jgi:hypothetical protein
VDDTDGPVLNVKLKAKEFRNAIEGGADQVQDDLKECTVRE